MEYVLIVFSSVTVSNRAKKLAKQHFDYAMVVQLPSNLGIRGCSYCLKIKKSDYEKMLSIAKEYKMHIKAAFLEKETEHGKEYESL